MKRNIDGQCLRNLMLCVCVCVCVCVPVVPVGLLVYVKLWDVHLFILPGGLVVGQVSPLDQVVHIPILIKSAGNTTDMIKLWRGPQHAVCVRVWSCVCVYACVCVGACVSV